MNEDEPKVVLYADGFPGKAPGRYLMKSHYENGAPGPDIVIIVEPGKTDRWEVYKR